MSQSIVDPEIRALLASLDAQRDHVLGILEGLSDDALRQPVLPSGWTCLGLVQHLTLDVERFWFRAVVAGDTAIIAGLETTPDPWRVGSDVPASAIFAGYRREAELANAIVAATAPDAPPAWWPGELFGDFRLGSLREIVLHVIAETATHAGHLDATRELLDERQWLVITG